MRLSQMIVLGAVMLAFALSGCTSYYRVSDPTGNKEYYTTDVDNIRGGAIKITDERTGSVVTLQSSEVKEITKEEFEMALKGGQEKEPAAMEVSEEMTEETPAEEQAVPEEAEPGAEESPEE